MILDVQAHLFPDTYLDLLTELGKDDVPESRAQRGARDTDEDLAERIRMMDDAGVHMHVLSPAGQLPYFAEEAKGVKAARMCNDLFAKFVAKRPDRLASFCAVPLPHVDAAIAEMNRGLDELGMAGVTIGSSVLGRSLADPAFERFYAALNEREAILYVHPAGRGAESPLIRPDMVWVIGAPIEDTMAAFHLIRRGIPSRYPKIKIIVAHLGGALPILLGRLDFLYKFEVPDLPELPSVAARRMWYDSVGHDDPIAIRAAVEAFGADHLIMGSDYPYQLDDDYTRSVEYIRDSGLSAKDAETVLNAASDRLFADVIARSRAKH